MPCQSVGGRLRLAVPHLLKALDQIEKFEKLQDILKSMEGPICRVIDRLDNIEDSLSSLRPTFTDGTLLSTLIRFREKSYIKVAIIATVFLPSSPDRRSIFRKFRELAATGSCLRTMVPQQLFISSLAPRPTGLRQEYPCVSKVQNTLHQDPISIVPEHSTR